MCASRMGARPCPYGTAEYALRLSAFRFRFFLFFIVSRIERRSIRERYPGYVCEAAIAKNQAGTTTCRTSRSVFALTDRRVS